ncbi:hypothetical protein [Rubellimicrobium roseum]|uniref:Uncharacterized protein n=1 Tax=Rubellimicrobium roseum TaxID=687525 RepID=A0A5C4N873_9RHOB|nr:hypothetical protein [Rubellimicrobium roseum]TNC63987.1 hypothetical protein FHG71_18790 [Rubellimicrobium roseum]
MTFRPASLLALSTTALLTGMPALAQAPDFGADTSVWANDGECDDPRFTGPGTSGMDMDANLMADATDCRTAFEAGTAQLAQGQVASPAAPAAPTSPAPAANGAQIAAPTAPAEPVAPQSSATPAAPAPDTAQATPPVQPAAPDAQAPAPVTKGAQATAPTEPAQPTAPVQVNFGDDSGQWAGDGECDDRRFAGQGMAVSLNWLSVGRDATDCRALYDAGSIRLWAPKESQAATQCAAIDFGDNMSQFANDAECDDPRFEGLGVAGILNPSETGHDAADCSQLCAFGAASLRDY